MLQLNGNRKLSGVLRGFDPFMNLVLEETIDETNYGGTEKSSNKASLGMIVSVNLWGAPFVMREKGMNA